MIMVTREDKIRNACAGHSGNRAERQFDEAIAVSDKGWRSLSSGWPDRLLIRGAQVRLVEVKPTAKTRLEPAQEEIMRALSMLGVKCYRWNPEQGGVPWDAPYPQDIYTAPKRVRGIRKCSDCGSAIERRMRCDTCRKRIQRDRNKVAPIEMPDP